MRFHGPLRSPVLSLCAIIMLARISVADSDGGVIHATVTNEKELISAIDSAAYSSLLIIDIAEDIFLTYTVYFFGQYNPFTWVRGRGHRIEMSGKKVNGLLTKYRCFNVVNNARLNMSDLTISGCLARSTSSTSTGGGAMYLDSSTLNVENCKFIRNNADNVNGGAISADKSAINIVRSTFLGNYATSPNGGAALGTNGGAIYLSNSKLNIESSNIDSNGCFYYGGASKGGGQAPKLYLLHHSSVRSLLLHQLVMN